MEEITELLATSVEVTHVPNNTAKQHPRFAQYKAKSKPNSVGQNDRRERLLELQKKERLEHVNDLRKLATDGFEGEHSEDRQGKKQHVTKMEVDTKQSQRNLMYKDQLMLSEWLVDVPKDLAEEWILLPCPVGRRNIIVASKGDTRCYTKNGHLIKTFSSLLPGGHGGRYKTKHNEYTLLDCIFSEVDRTFFVLDVLSWNGHPVVDSETEFRFFWLKSKFEETPMLSEYSKQNQLKFVTLKTYPCTKQGISEALEADFSYQIDGLLFYHKRVHYSPGTTPLVGWLKPFMTQEILNIHVPEKYHSGTPQNYSNLKQHISETANEKKPKRRSKHKGRGDAEGMET